MNTFPISELQAFFFEVAGSSSLDDLVLVEVVSLVEELCVPVLVANEYKRIEISNVKSM